jgi:hypothetical protein
MEDTDMNWRKASYSSNGGANCVEVATADTVLVRDTTDREGMTLAFTASAWDAFTGTLRSVLRETPFEGGPFRGLPSLRARPETPVGA